MYLEKSQSLQLLCLQETHCSEQHVYGSTATDECFSAQLGTLILVDESLDVVGQMGNGSGRLAMVAVKSPLSKEPPPVVVVVNI